MNAIRKKVLRGFFELNMSRYTVWKLYAPSFCIGVIRKWIRLDSRYIRTINIRSNNPYSPVLKLKAIEYILQGNTYLSCAIKYNIKKRQLIHNWVKLFEIHGKEYFFMARKYKKKVKLAVPDDLDLSKIDLKKATPDELYAYTKQLEFERDFYKETTKVLSKEKGLTKNKDKKQVVKRLGLKYTNQAVIKKTKLPKRTYYNNTKKSPRNIENKRLVENYLKLNTYEKGKIGRRKIQENLKNANICVSGYFLRQILKENDWLMKQTKKMKKFVSYKKDGNPACYNWLLSPKKTYDPMKKKMVRKHFFKQDEKYRVFVSDVTEFHICGIKIFLSTIVDLYDNKPVCWKISKHPDMDLCLGNLKALIKKLGKDHEPFVYHTDQGSCYRSPAFKQYCKDNHILQSMSRKGKSGDNAPMEGFFGRLKQMFFNENNFNKYSYEKFVSALEYFLTYFWGPQSLKKGVKTC
jgi:transposase InsO family protein/transposase-like protein